MLEIERIGFWADLKKEFIQATDTQINIQKKENSWTIENFKADPDKINTLLTKEQQ